MTAAEFLTTSELADWLGIPESTLRRWRHEKRELPVYEMGGRPKYRRADVERWLARNRVPAVRTAS